MMLDLDAMSARCFERQEGMASGEELKQNGPMKSIENSLFESVRSVIERARKHVYSVANVVLLESYWEIGRLIVEDEQAGLQRAGYGKATLKNLSKQLTEAFGKGFDDRNLNNMRAFYHAFPNWYAVRTELSWTHYRILSRIEDLKKREYYLSHCGHVGWDSRTLQRNINSLYYERAIALPAADEPTQAAHHIKDPYIFEFLDIPVSPKIREDSLESAIIEHIKYFLLELGKGFAFVGRQQHVVTDTSDFYIDLVFYNYILKCFVVIDLKTTALSHQDIGQIDMYVRMFDDLKRIPGDNPTIGILLCTEKDETIVKYSILAESKQLFASKYILFLPDEKALQNMIDQGRTRYASEFGS
jgi:predicted nuclease of restriction endonuclease-like (RecB) superfamily